MSKTNFAGLLGLALLSVLATSRTQAQGLGNSPYSRLGIGDFTSNTGGVRQLGMGGVGVAAPNSGNVNELNPALLYYTSRTTYEAGFNGQFKSLHTATASHKTGSGTLGYLAMSIPLSKRWAAAAGLKPYSSVDYESNTVEAVPNSPTGARVLKMQKGKGGLSEAYLAQGFRLAKGLTVGATASYVFGSVDLSTGSSVAPKPTTSADSLTSVLSVEHLHYSDFAFRGGLHYRGKVNDKVNYNLGGVYSFQTQLNGTRSATLNRENASALLLESLAQVTDQKGKAVIPALTQLGLSLDNNKNWSANLDVAQQQWSKYQAFTGSTGSTLATPLANTLRLGLGGELTPDPTSVDSYFKRVGYRAGLSIAQLPYRPNGQVLYDRAFSWGFAFPLPSATPLDATIVSLAFAYGQRGNTKSYSLTENGTTRTVNNVKDDYLRVQLGVTLNNRWFIKHQIE